MVAFTSGVFSVYDVQEDDIPLGVPTSRVVTLHTLSISTSSLTTAAISPSGEWLAFGSGSLPARVCVCVCARACARVCHRLQLLC